VIAPAGALSLLSDVDVEGIRVQRVASEATPLARGEPASTGVASGAIALSAERAGAWAADRAVILVRETASPDDIAGMAAASGLLTARGVRTSHAAVVARQMGKVCIVNCAELSIDPGARRCRIGAGELAEGALLTLDGNTGNVYPGRVEVSQERPEELLALFRSWKAGAEKSKQVGKETG
jgi:pyruvate,orthophosphate dikinase